MKALSSPSLDLFPCNHRVGLCSRKISLGRQEICVFGDQRRPAYGLRLAVSFQNKSISSSSASASAQTNAEIQEIQTMDSEMAKTVRVRFNLLKECAFGQQFLIVGDDPVLGEWDPSGAVPLTWSDGHLWTAQVDMPADALFKYKFILKGAGGALTWQPGSDRTLKTWSTEKAISVFEDWCNPELQEIVEEELTTDLQMEALIDSNTLIAAENAPATVVEGTGSIEEDANDNGVAIYEEKPVAPMVVENITRELSSNDKESTPVTLEDVIAGTHLLTSDDGAITVSNEEAPVLVTGLNTMPQEVIAEPELAQVENSILDNAATVPAPDQIGALAEPKHCSESNEIISDEKQQENEKEQPGNVPDMQWGKQTLLKFLSSFGFQQQSS